MSMRIGRYDYLRREYMLNWEKIESELGGVGQAVEFRRGPFQVTRERKLARTWWGQLWIDQCEAQTNRKTINKGWRIGRDGAIWVVRLAPGNSSAMISENSYYASYANLIGVNLPTLSLEQWQTVDTIMMENSRYLAGLMAGNLLQELYEQLLENGIDLIPQPDFYSNDYNRYRRHITPHGLALAYLLGAFIDDNPLLLFRLLGRDPDLLVERWIGESPRYDESTIAESDPASFWISQRLPPSEDMLSLTPPPNINGLPSEYLGKIPEIREWVAEEAALDLVHIRPLVDDTERPVFPPIRRQPDVALNAKRQARHDELIALTDAYCEEMLDSEFVMLARRLTRALLAQSKPFVINGHAGTWAAAIVYALAEINQLFEDNISGYQLDPDVLCAAFKRSPNTTMTRARRIRKRLGIGTMDPDWIHSTHRANDPKAHMVRVRGFLISRLDHVTAQVAMKNKRSS